MIFSTVFWVYFVFVFLFRFGFGFGFFFERERGGERGWMIGSITVTGYLMVIMHVSKISLMDYSKSTIKDPIEISYHYVTTSHITLRATPAHKVEGYLAGGM